MQQRPDVGIRVKVVRRAVHGVLLLDKPLGLSSNDALQRAKWLLRAEKAGHTGTLDPLATGVLPLCFGAATKFSQLHLDADKSYVAVARLGQTTSTGDTEGALVLERDVRLHQADLDRVRPSFTGSILQVPPMYSALKKDGKPLYAYARAGLHIERAARPVTITALALGFGLDAQGQTLMHMQVSCSKGTYIRALAQDIGEALGCGAHLTVLRRVATGGFVIGQCIGLDQLGAIHEDHRAACLLPVQALLADHDEVTLDGAESDRFLSGLPRRGRWPDAARVAVYRAAPRALLGTAHVQAGELIPGRLLNPVEVAQAQAAPLAATPAVETIYERET